MSWRIEVDQEQIAAFCRKHRIRKLAFFGSVLRDDFRPDSDVDVLVDYEPGARVRLAEVLGMERELASLLGRRVDLVEREAVMRSPNYIRRNEVLRSAEVVYAA
ncbi:MAG: nucleotidyltransferase domain-containing protein [Armatimonadetes bacterium]|nr:nucleotidyltransferase domain-containing protein [Armatimonadota bacterium]